MFDFLKRSRAFRFLCSACLICSLGSFAGVYGQENEQESLAVGDPICELYVQGKLGYTQDKIFLANPSLNKTGMLTGSLMFAKELDELSSPDESNAESLWNNLEDSEITLFLKNKNDRYIAASAKVTFDGNSDDNKYAISAQLYKLSDNDAPAQITNTESAERLNSLVPGKYTVTGIVSEKGDHTLLEGPVL